MDKIVISCKSDDNFFSCILSYNKIELHFFYFSANNFRELVKNKLLSKDKWWSKILNIAHLAPNTK
jgi:hypothetical protein